MQFQAASMTLISFHGGCHMGFGISGRSRRGRTCWLDVQDMTWKYIATKEAKLCFDAVQFSHLNLSWRISRTGYLWHQRHHLAHRNTDRRSAIERERGKKGCMDGTQWGELAGNWSLCKASTCLVIMNRIRPLKFRRKNPLFHSKFISMITSQVIHVWIHSFCPHLWSAAKLTCGSTECERGPWKESSGNKYRSKFTTQSMP